MSQHASRTQPPSAASFVPARAAVLDLSTYAPSSSLIGTLRSTNGDHSTPLLIVDKEEGNLELPKTPKYLLELKKYALKYGHDLVERHGPQAMARAENIVAAVMHGIEECKVSKDTFNKSGKFNSDFIPFGAEDSWRWTKAQTCVCH